MTCHCVFSSTQTCHCVLSSTQLAIVRWHVMMYFSSTQLAIVRWHVIVYLVLLSLPLLDDMSWCTSVLLSPAIARWHVMMYFSSTQPAIVRWGNVIHSELPLVKPLLGMVAMATDMSDHPLSMTYQITKWPVICQINGMTCHDVLQFYSSTMPDLLSTLVFYLPNHVVQEYLTVGHAEPVHLTKVFYLPIHVVQEYLTVGHAEPVPPNQGVLLTKSCSTGKPDCWTCRACIS